MNIDRLTRILTLILSLLCVLVGWTSASSPSLYESAAATMYKRQATTEGRLQLGRTPSPVARATQSIHVELTHNPPHASALDEKGKVINFWPDHGVRRTELRYAFHSQDPFTVGRYTEEQQSHMSRRGSQHCPSQTVDKRIDSSLISGLALESRHTEGDDRKTTNSATSVYEKRIVEDSRGPIDILMEQTPAVLSPETRKKLAHGAMLLAADAPSDTPPDLQSKTAPKQGRARYESSWDVYVTDVDNSMLDNEVRNSIERRANPQSLRRADTPWDIFTSLSIVSDSHRHRNARTALLDCSRLGLS